MKLRATVGDEFFLRREIAFQGPSSLEALKDCGANVGTPANCRGVSKRPRGRLDRSPNLSLPRRRPFSLVSAGMRQRTSAHQRPRPRAKILRAERLAHYFLDILINMSALDVDKFPVLRLKLENLRLAAPEQDLKNSRNLTISQLAILAHTRFSREVEPHQIALDRHVLRFQGGYPITTVFARINLTSRTQEAG